ncbi:MAG: peptidoglycan-binding protein [Phycisphaerae bacterium]|nr:peptidoglycan-binding protein [Saprospiraceae bacterium]
MKKFICLLLLLNCAAWVAGQTKPEILRTQNALLHLGLYTGQPDGMFGPRTAAAVRGFQANNALAATGKLDSATLAALSNIQIPKPSARSGARISLSQAVQEGLVDAQVSGSDIQYVELELRPTVEYTLNLEIEAGTYFVCRSGAQNMVSRQTKILTLTPKTSIEVSLEAACANRPKDIPDSDDRFDVAPAPHQDELSRLMPLLEKEDVDYTTVQAAVWIVTDDADFGDLGILSDGYGRAIDCDDTVLAMQRCEKVGIDITHKNIWHDRVYLQGCVSSQALKNWLKNHR